MRFPEAFAFLAELQRRLEKSLPPVDDLRFEVRRVLAESKVDEAAKHKRTTEDAFLYHFVFPALHEYVQEALVLSAAEARQALLSEYYKNMPALCSGTPARRLSHPFDKTLTSPHAVMLQWKGMSRSASPLRQSCPDFALRAPSPYTVVFEGKYFERGTAKKAENDLVTNIYQSFFYRALPRIEATKSKPAWDYDFGCLLACDASVEGNLRTAWDSLPSEAKVGFWEGAHLYVMVLRPVN